MLYPLAGIFHQSLTRVQIIAGRDHGEEQQKRAGQCQKRTLVRQSAEFGLRPAAHEGEERTHAQSEPDQIEQQLHRDAWVV